jgi:NAD(P)-dependent dehydrogenase (short-subunit alcohol dehydrogenase family)
LGYYCAQTIAASHPDWHIIIVCRNQQHATQAVNTLKHETGNQHIEGMFLDLASLLSVRSFARDFASRKLPPLRAVVCNAGIQVVSGTAYTQDGFETTFGVNCLGHFLLVNLLLRHLVAPAQIVFVSSGVHYPNQEDFWKASRESTLKAPENEPLLRSPITGKKRRNCGRPVPSW